MSALWRASGPPEGHPPGTSLPGPLCPPLPGFPCPGKMLNSNTCRQKSWAGSSLVSVTTSPPIKLLNAEASSPQLAAWGGGRRHWDWPLPEVQVQSHACQQCPRTEATSKALAFIWVGNGEGGPRLVPLHLGSARLSNPDTVRNRDKRTRSEGAGLGSAFGFRDSPHQQPFPA